MSCLLAIVGFFVPRFLLFCIFVFSDWFSKTYDTVIWPLLGFFFMPYTTLAYMYGMYGDREISTFEIVILIIAVCLDFSVGKSATNKRK